jgi:hypothetical protein
MNARKERMTLEELKRRFELLLTGLHEIDSKIDVLNAERDTTCDEMHKVANQIWEIEDPEAYAIWKRGPK